MLAGSLGASPLSEQQLLAMAQPACSRRRLARSEAPPRCRRAQAAFYGTLLIPSNAFLCSLLKSQQRFKITLLS